MTSVHFTHNLHGLLWPCVVTPVCLLHERHLGLSLCTFRGIGAVVVVPHVVRPAAHVYVLGGDGCRGRLCARDLVRIKHLRLVYSLLELQDIGHSRGTQLRRKGKGKGKSKN